MENEDVMYDATRTLLLRACIVVDVIMIVDASAVPRIDSTAMIASPIIDAMWPSTFSSIWGMRCL